MKKLFFLFHLSVLVMLLSCARDKQAKEYTSGMQHEITPVTTIKYASRFDISYFDRFKKITVNEAWPGSQDTLTYILTRDKDIIEEYQDDNKVTLIRQPIHKVVCFSTTHLSFLELLELEDRLCGFPTINYIYSEKIRNMALKGRIKDLGPANDINFESLLSLDPDLVFAFSMGNELSMVRKIQLAAIPLVMNADYLENHPLGRAEWIKFIATFFDKDQEADSIFRQIEGSYLDTKVRIAEEPEKPSVFTGVVYGDTWFMPGGKNYGTVFFKDAGGDYAWSENNSESILQLSFESVYVKAGQADYWIGTATYNSLKEIEEADARYRDFKAFQSGNVYNYSAKINPSGGNAYFEMGYARPDIILKDLAKILHPDEMRDHQFYFYQKLY